jgi:hypothetical protein
VVLLVAGLAALLLYPLLKPNGDVSDPKPALPPREEDRLYHPAGFSLVMPRGWAGEVLVRGEPQPGARPWHRNVLAIVPGTGARFESMLGATELAEPPDPLSGSTTTMQFGGAEASLFERELGRYYNASLAFRRDGRWFAVWLMLPNDKYGVRHQTVPDYWWPFLESFRLEDRSARVVAGGSADSAGEQLVR